MRRTAVSLILALGLFPGCTARHRPQVKAEDGESARMGRLSTVQHQKAVTTPDVRPPKRCFPQDAPGAPERPLEALLEFSHEQGLSSRRLRIDELFAPSTLKPIPLGEGQLI